MCDELPPHKLAAVEVSARQEGMPISRVLLALTLATFYGCDSAPAEKVAANNAVIPPLAVNVDRIATMNANGVRAELVKAGWETIKRDTADGGIRSNKPDGSFVVVVMSRGKPIRVIARLAPPFPEASPALFRSVLGISATPPPHDPFGVGTGTSFTRVNERGGTDVWLRWNCNGTASGKIFGPVYSAEARRVTFGDGEEQCVVSVDLVDYATMRRWQDE